MKVIYGLNKIKKYRRPVVALGVFDGVHIGHRQILNYAVKTARRINGKSVVLTFYPHPRKQKSLYSLVHRLRLIRELGVDVCIAVRFNQAFAKIFAVDFIKNILVKKINASYICVGKNFRFGRGAQGDIDLLDKFSKIYNYKLKVFDVVRTGNIPASSTYIRKLITEGNLDTAKGFLGRAVSVFGTVIRGGALAKRLGFPTANINPHHEVVPPPGIYAAVVILERRKLNGICYIGCADQVEVHLLDFSKNIYGKDLEIQFIKKLRDKKEFPSTQSLIKQIEKDVILTRRFFYSVRKPRVSTRGKISRVHTGFKAPCELSNGVYPTKIYTIYAPRMPP